MERRFIVVHDPNAKKPYGFDWVNWLDEGDSLESQQWSISPSGPTLSSPTLSGTQAYVWVDGGVAGVNYRLIDDIVTANGIEDRRSISVICVDR